MGRVRCRHCQGTGEIESDDTEWADAISVAAVGLAYVLTAPLWLPVLLIGKAFRAIARHSRAVA